MDPMSSGSGYEPDNTATSLEVRPKGLVGKDEALRMEADALNKMQHERRHKSQVCPSHMKAHLDAQASVTSLSQLEKDLIVFPESEPKKKSEKDTFADINVETLTNEELEKVLLDNNFGRPPSLLHHNLGASNTCGQTFSPHPLHWASMLSNSNSAMPTLTHRPSPVFPFQAVQLPVQQSQFLPFVSVQPVTPQVFHQPVINPEMARLFDKIASTSEYLKNGRSLIIDENSVRVKSLEPVLYPTDSPSFSCFDWLDLDPLSKSQVEVDDIPGALCGPVIVESVPASDPWDAVLQEDTEAMTINSSLAQEKEKCTTANQLRRASTGMAVTREKVPTISFLNSQSKVTHKSGKALGMNTILQENWDQNLEILAFCEDIAKLKSMFAHDDHSTNPGYVLNPVISHRDVVGDGSCSVKVSIEILDSQQPVTFTCDVSSPVELLIMQALCWAHDDLSQVNISSYVLKVCGQEQVLQNKHSLGSQEYVQNCRKWETEIKLQLLTHSTMKRDLARTQEDDDSSPIDLEKYLGDIEMPFKKMITRESLAEHLEEYHKQVNICLQKESTEYKVTRVIQVVKTLCYLLNEVETPAITKAVQKLRHAVNLPKTCSSEGDARSAFSTNGYASAVEEQLSALTSAVYDLVKLYLCSFCLDFPVHADQKHPENQRDSREASSITEHVHFMLFAIHGISASWASSYEKYYMMCALMHNDKNLLKPVKSKKVGLYKSFFYYIKWDELINFPISVALLPLETVLSLSLYGVLNQNSSNSPDSNKQHKGPELLGKVSMPLFDFRRMFARGRKLLSIWASPPFPLPVGKSKNVEERIILQIELPSPQVDVLYMSPPEMPFPVLQSEEMPDPDIRRRLEKLCVLAASSRLAQGDMQLLWDQRYYCHRYEHSLPKILASVYSWDWTSIPEIYKLLHSWPPLSPVYALELLDSKFADTEVRHMAVSWIEICSDDELIDYLPQLVQALKFESHLKNALVMFLFSRAQGNVNIAHQLYWLLRDAIQEPVFGQRYSHVLGALLCMCGAGLRGEFEKQTRLVKLLGALAENVRKSSSSNRQMVLQEGLEEVKFFFQRDNCRIPLSPSLVAKDLNIKACSFFNSNAVPLKLALVNADKLGEEINVMFKVGEDLRQDMLALQMIRIMDRIWLQEGLDLRIVNFKCISTGKDKGMVELVPSSETLRKIQVEYGVTGSFKDKPLAEWLRKYNPAEDEYEKAAENFVYSCAGCCVATYLLGICDRHNDNIMLRTTGHMFHIDFGKFLGHAQMIGSFKRDRAPFVLTSDMAYVINGGERPTSRFQLFVDLCSQAYNLIRKHSSLFLNLLSLMTQSGLPELTGTQDLKYVYDALQPQSTDTEATVFFTRLIESSLGSVATKFNFFIHNLAQLRFSGLPSNDEPILSFSSRTYTLKQEGCIRDASIFSFQKRYNPDKHYIYVVRILRERQSEPQFVFRTFDEFQELHNKLTIIFPLWKIPGFPNKLVLGRKHIKDVASKRKLELNIYVHNLMRSSAEVAQCDLIYTFFHPLARDDKTEGLDGLLKVPEEPPISPAAGRDGGEVKLSVSYRNETLFVMVMHIKDLVSDDGAGPNPYVKMYLLPDPHKTSKRKTKVSRKTRNPTYNEMLVYSGYSKETLKQRELQLNVLSAEYLRENCYLGGITLSLKNFDLSQETVKWYRLIAGSF
ncbi:phosphatidylinositol 4-phosphate 3-kinase C2 domain-containing subunit alpha isoform X1 [Tachysurus vachellii]|uniref:phosphatidylinositol 4-phosphate 3-kinase C2 domain-containing subunit alpha isoform X1 n=1 Tax=Tachysurus vachellii TaxID=175792 RepID=UPI00296ABCEB|nr:phosphatidylinositol 4-phosphate 3-kinase C2 domain-containing subunit alpha isoform X1 [Tachysurus vachellii]XP_060733674.1 phosphatidylinositol 4-phosphate 3-kinase C2 domain-containing subunit alpha isoform X1 [Tachysurus vachellii]XP_060733675.1 phosphatidylinositol 4-phosphate 3-kinase C2 domain-containing subunit alpha isoform X1 [Tachysurus vachellii]